MQANLFPTLGNFKLVKISDHDAKWKTDFLLDWRRLILANEDMYPSIGKWLDNKVLAGLMSGERLGYVGLIDDTPVISAVVRKGRVGKFCHFTQNLHVYDRHNSAVDELLSKESLEIQPIIKLKENKNFYDFTIDDFEIIGIKDIEKIKSPLELAI